MRRFLGSNAVLLLLVTVLPCPGKLVKEPSYSSDKPLYALVMLDEDATKVVTIVFDESQGTGKGYDTIYADLNLNGDLTDDKTIKGTLKARDRLGMTYWFGPIALDVPYNEKARGAKKPWELFIRHGEYTERKLLGLIRGETHSSFSLTGWMKLKDERGEWVYTLLTGVEPVESLPEASPVRFCVKPTLQVDAIPDRQKKGNTGIGAYVRLGSNKLHRWRRGDQEVPAQVRVKNRDGKTVHSEDVSLAKLSFG
jgi:hypothetical protein